MTITSLADVVGASTTTAIAATPKRARWVALCALSGTARVGASNAAATVGVQIIQNVPQTLWSAGEADSIDLSKLYLYTPSGTTVTITYGT